MVEAKKDEVEASECTRDSEKLALLRIRYKFIYQIDMETGDEHVVESFPTPDLFL